MGQSVLAIDVGGTNCRAGIVHDEHITWRMRQTVGAARSPAAMLRLLHHCVVQALAEDTELAGVSVGAPGIVNPVTGVVERSPHFPDWEGFALREALHEACALPVVLDNDANMIARGEAAYGAGKDLPYFTLLTFGTGIGGAIVSAGHVQTGECGYAGEVGHMLIDPAGPPCACGGLGHWENFASASGFHHLAQIANVPACTPVEAAERARRGESEALHLWQCFGRYVAIGVANLCNVLGHTQFVIGGGLASAWDFFVPSVYEHLPQFMYPNEAPRIQLHRAVLGDDAGLFGGAAAFVELRS